MRPLPAFIAAAMLIAAARTSAAAGDAPDDQATVMHALARHGLHDLEDERFNAYGQSTWISSFKLPFSAAYTNANGSPNSLLTGFEHSWTWSLTLYAGVKLWPGAEVYFVPEVIAEQPLSGLKGLGGAIQNFELQKTGGTAPQIYRSRLYLQQTIGLGGKSVARESGPMQLGGRVDRRRLVFRVGNFSVIDFFDKNSVTGDPRETFFNMAFMTYAAFDFVADARGYSWGGMAELDWDDWALRVGRLAPPTHPNVLPLTFELDKYYGDQFELSHDHKILGQPGAARLIAYRNVENMGRFDEAVAAFQADPSKNAAACTDYNYGSTNSNAPDLCWVRRPNVKVGIGLNVEQQLTKDIGVFFRGMYSDGRTEVYAFTSTDRSISFGVLAKGSLWHRPRDVAGLGVGVGWISDAHAAYLRLGGIDGFIGDGNINPAAESVFEALYSLNVWGGIWLSADYQHITNPAFNADRGPVDVFGVRAHVEF